MWDLQAALDPRAPAGTLCLRTLVVCVTVEPNLTVYSQHAKGLFTHAIYCAIPNHRVNQLRFHGDLTAICR